SGDFRHIVFRDCVLEGRRHFVKGELSSGISVQTVDGGTLEHVSVSNIRMKNIRAPFFVRRARRGRGQEVPTPGALRDVTIADVTATGASGTGSILGIPGHPVTRVTLRNIRVTARGGEKADAVTLNIPEMERLYPDAYLFGELPAYALYGRHVDGLVVEGLDATVEMRDAPPAGGLDDGRTAEPHGHPPGRRGTFAPRWSSTASAGRSSTRPGPCGRSMAARRSGSTPSATARCTSCAGGGGGPCRAGGWAGRP